MAFSVKGNDRTCIVRDFKIVLRRDKKELEVFNLFDARGSETFDHTEAFEAFVGDDMLPLTTGDELVFVFQ